MFSWKSKVAAIFWLLQTGNSTTLSIFAGFEVLLLLYRERKNISCSKGSSQHSSSIGIGRLATGTRETCKTQLSEKHFLSMIQCIWSIYQEEYLIIVE